MRKFYYLMISAAILAGCQTEAQTKTIEKPQEEVPHTKEDWIKQSGIKTELASAEDPIIEVIHIRGRKQPEILASYTKSNPELNEQTGILIGKSFDEKTRKWKVFFREEAPAVADFRMVGPITVEYEGKQTTRVVVEHQSAGASMVPTSARLFGFANGEFKQIGELTSEYVETGKVAVEDNLIVFKGEEQQDSFQWSEAQFESSPELLNSRKELGKYANIMLEYEAQAGELTVTGDKEGVVYAQPGGTIGIRQSGLVKGSARIFHSLKQADQPGLYTITEDDHNRDIVFDFQYGHTIKKVTILLESSLQKEMASAGFFDQTFVEEIRQNKLKGIVYPIGTMVDQIKTEKGKPDFEENWSGSLVFGYKDHAFGYLETENAKSIHYVSYFPGERQLFFKEAEKVLGVPGAEGVSDKDGNYFQLYDAGNGKELWLEGTSEQKDSPIREIRLIQK
ncbi:hypothetical protein CVD25_15795 [Bacillus canaveralius]|uniref:Lipoprotein n=1 Tax=Bacillus canaveralius TaxID=1403243 RepID=A0A2N5GFL8_9BACI|nr:hypothetical protein [Bacillus canaveralius]PLR79521.1 hypothetical protein CU635_22785 [Bacillus canaveralius]PLR94922.1 hypothetical protein CVD25_15795 [Bacillus canaveralius]